MVVRKWISVYFVRLVYVLYIVVLLVLGPIPKSKIDIFHFTISN